MSIHDELVTQFETYVAESARFEQKGIKASAARARKALTEISKLCKERRKEIVKDVKKIGEDAKVAVRNIRRDMTDDLKKLEKSENLPEDTVKDNQDKIQKLTDKYTGIIDKAVAEKEKEVMTV